MTWENINEPVSVDDDLTFLTVIILLGGCSVFYGLVTWYVEAVFPGEYGMPKPWYFFATVSQFSTDIIIQIVNVHSCVGS